MCVVRHFEREREIFVQNLETERERERERDLYGISNERDRGRRFVRNFELEIQRSRRQQMNWFKSIFATVLNTLKLYRFSVI